MGRWPLIPLLLLSLAACAQDTDRPAASQPNISAAVRDEDGFLMHRIDSPYQNGATDVRVLLPSELEPGKRYPVVYMLPVEAGREQRYGDGMREVQRHGLQNRFGGVVVVGPSFAALPWYADHPSDAGLRQESYLLNVVIPFIEQAYPASPAATDRLLLGFSKSGWGAWSLLLRHPQQFGRAAAWDAPLMMREVGKYGNGPIFGGQENFAKYRIADLLVTVAPELGIGGRRQRLIHMGYGNFRDHHQQAEALVTRLGISHTFRDGPERKHDWHSGWVSEAFALLLKDDQLRKSP